MFDISRAAISKKKGGKQIMMENEAYLFVHFKEKYTPDGEQVYFGLSRDGFTWEQTNGGKPILWSRQGDEGVRDFTITRTKDGRFVILATDLSLANHFKDKYHGSWDTVNHEGSKFFSRWESGDLVHWSSQSMVRVVDDSFGCAWAPDIIYDEAAGDYLVHWSSYHAGEPNMAIYYAKTKDFVIFSEPKLLCRKEEGQIIDSNIVYHAGWYYRFIKDNRPDGHIYLEKGKTLTGEYESLPAFDEEMIKLQPGQYEAPTCFQMANGQWCVMLDFYGCDKNRQGYVPFVADDIASGRFVRSDAKFSFPYGFKHGTVLPITAEEYNRIKKAYPNSK